MMVVGSSGVRGVINKKFYLILIYNVGNIILFFYSIGMIVGLVYN